LGLGLVQDLDPNPIPKFFWVKLLVASTIFKFVITIDTVFTVGIAFLFGKVFFTVVAVIITIILVFIAVIFIITFVIVVITVYTVIIEVTVVIIDSSATTIPLNAF